MVATEGDSVDRGAVMALAGVVRPIPIQRPVAHQVGIRPLGGKRCRYVAGDGVAGNIAQPGHESEDVGAGEAELVEGFEGEGKAIGGNRQGSRNRAARGGERYHVGRYRGWVDGFAEHKGEDGCRWYLRGAISGRDGNYRWRHDIGY